MPYIHVSVPKPMSPEQKESLKASAGKLVEILPGKTERGLMIRIDDGQKMYFRGVEGNCAYVHVCLYLMSPDDKKAEFAHAFTGSLAEIAGLDPLNIYLSFAEFGNWYSNGVPK